MASREMIRKSLREQDGGKLIMMHNTFEVIEIIRYDGRWHVAVMKDTLFDPIPVIIDWWLHEV